MQDDYKPSNISVTATVDKTAYVSEDSTVGDGAKVTDFAQVFNHSFINGVAEITAGAKVEHSMISDYAKVYNACILFAASVYGQGDIHSTDDYIVCGPLGRYSRIITLHRDREYGIRVVAGCFDGHIGKFLSALQRDEYSHRLYRQVVPALWLSLFQRINVPKELEADSGLYDRYMEVEKILRKGIIYEFDSVESADINQLYRR